MKFMVSQLTYFLSEREGRRNLRALLKVLLILLSFVAVYSVLFHVLMLYEGQEHSWLTGVYWTLTVMSTLGFGDITFHTDLGRVFSLVVLLSGVVLLLIMLPFAFIRYLYAPWIEAQIRARAPRSAPDDASGHLVICRYDSIAQALIHKLDLNHLPYFVIEPDPVAAERMIGDGISVVTGEIDSRATYEKLRLPAAKMVLANAEDMVNTNITLTVRAVDARVPICALADNEDSIDILELSGATIVLPLKRRLGEHLAARITTGADSAHVVGSFRDLQIVEFIVHDTALSGQTLQQTRLRELTGVNVVSVWEQGQLQPARADHVLGGSSVPVAIGTEEQVTRLNEMLSGPAAEHKPVLVIGGGRVGRAAASALKRRGVPVHVVDKNPRRKKVFGDEADRLIIGDAADRSVLFEAGLEQAGAVALTTNDDAVNIHLTVYCRRLKPELNIVTRITHQRNIEAIYRAGADSALSYTSLGREYVISRLLGREPVMVGEGADFFLVDVPRALTGKSLAESEIGARVGLIVIAIENGGETLTNPLPSVLLPKGGRLLMLGTTEQRETLRRGVRVTGGGRRSIRYHPAVPDGPRFSDALAHSLRLPGSLASREPRTPFCC